MKIIELNEPAVDLKFMNHNLNLHAFEERFFILSFELYQPTDIIEITDLSELKQIFITILPSRLQYKNP